MRLSFLYACRLIKQSRKLYFIAILNIALGLLGLFVLQNFKFSIQDSVQSRVLSLMGSHLSVSSRSIIPEDELSAVEALLPEFDKRFSQSFYTMMQGPKGLRLVQVIAQEEGYPFFGGLELRSGVLYPSNARLLKQEEALLSPELQIQLGVQVGDEFEIGEGVYKVRDFIEKDLGQSFSAFSLAPKVYITVQNIEATELIQTGSIVSKSYHYKFSQELSTSKIKQLQKKILSPGIRLSTPDRNGDQISRLLNYLNDFLGLSSLMAFTLVCIGLHYYYKSQADRWYSEAALLKYLGIKKSQIFFAFFFFMALVGGGGTLLTMLLGMLLSPFIQILIVPYLGADFQLNFYWKTPLIVVFIAVIGNVSLSIPVIYPILKSRTAAVFNSKIASSRVKMLSFCYIPFTAFMFAMAVGLSNSFLLGALFIGLVIGVLIITTLSAILFLYLGAFISNRAGGSAKLSMRYLTHYKASTITMVSSLALSVGLMILIPGIQKSIELEIMGEDVSNRSSFFLFDIQEEEVQALEDFCEHHSFGLATVLPMVRSRILKINSNDFNRSINSGFTREEEFRQRFRNRVVNLSYGSQIPEGDKVTEGKWFEDRYNWETEEWAEISIETRYAKRLGIELGDRVEFEVLGMPVKAEVTSIRQVNWTRFNPNFFLILQPGTLEMAPKTWLASSSHFSEKEQIRFQELLFERFPTISVVNVDQIAERVFGIIQQMSSALIGMSVMSLLVAFIVLGTLIYQKVLMRRNDLGLLKILGMTEKRVTLLIVMECIAIAFLSCVVGGISGLGLVSIFSIQLLSNSIFPITSAYWIIPSIVVPFSGWIAYFVIKKLQHHKDFYRQVF